MPRPLGSKNKKPPPLKLLGEVYYTYYWDGRYPDRKKIWVPLYGDYDKSLQKAIDIRKTRQARRLGLRVVRVSFEHFWKEFIRLTAPHKKENEIKIEEYIIQRLIRDTGITDAEQFTPKFLMEWRANQQTKKLKEGERRLSPASLNRYMQLFKPMGKCAVKWKYVDAPASEFEEIKRVHAPKPKKFAYTPDQIKAIYGQAQKDRDFDEELFLDVCFQTGMRETEIRFFELTDVDFEQDTIRVQEKIKWTPKSYRPRWFPITDKLKAKLLKLKGNKKRKTDYVITYAGKQAKRWYLGKKFKKILNRPEKDEDKIPGSIHIARHTWITELQKKHPRPVVQQWAGHSDEKTTRESYTHFAPEAGFERPVLPF